MTVRDTQRFSGAFPALPTPFDQDGQLCTEPLRTLVRDLILQGVEGFYALGSTGESLLLSVEERKTALEAVVAEARRKLAENKDLYLSAFYDDSYKILPYIVEYAYSKNIATLEKILGSDAVSEQDKYNVRVWVYGGMHIFTEWLAGRIDTPKEKLLEYSYNSVPDIIKRAEKLK